MARGNEGVHRDSRRGGLPIYGRAASESITA